jgi:DNA repair exonuclease SbcCD ATPase subunit
MKSLATVAILIAFSLTACAAQQRMGARTAREEPATPSAQATTPEASSNTWRAVRVVQVSLDERDDAARSAVQQIMGADVAAEVLRQRGLPADSGIIRVRQTPRDEKNAIDVAIEVNLAAADQSSPRVAREIANDMVRLLRQDLLREAQGPIATQARLFEEENATAQAELERARAELAQLRTKMREATGRANASAERVRDEVNHLEDSRQEIQLEMESKAARMKALTDNIAQLTAKVEDMVKNDAVAAELQKLVEAREKQVERVKTLVESGQASRGDYEEAVAQAAEARARLLDRRNDTAHSAGGDALNSWNQEIMALGVDTAELAAKLNRLNERLDGYRRVMDDVDRLEMLRESMEDAEQRVHESRAHLRDLQRKMASIRPPRSVLLESQDSTGAVPPDAAQQWRESARDEPNRQAQKQD